MDRTSLIFWLFMMTFSAALAFGFFQVRKTDQSQKAHGDDPKALTHKHDRQEAEVEKERQPG